MASSQTTGRKQQVNLAANVARVTMESNKAKDNQPLPPDMQSDLRDSFEFFAKGNFLINRSDFESIIHNFGFNRISQSEKKEELKKFDNEWEKRTGFDYEFLEKIVNMRWYKGQGAQQECLDAFHVFDSFERVFIKPGDLKRVFADYLDHPVTEQDIADIMAECDKSNTGSISYTDFKKFYFS